MRWCEREKKVYIFGRTKVLKACASFCHGKFNKEDQQQQQQKIPNEICQTVARRDKIDVSKLYLFLIPPQCSCLGKLYACTSHQ